MRIMSFDMIWMLATSDRIVSLNTSMMIAISAPSPDRKAMGDTWASSDTATTPAAMYASKLTTCR